MNNKNSILNIAKKTIEIESDAIANLNNLLNEDFANAVELIFNSKGVYGRNCVCKYGQ